MQGTRRSSSRGRSDGEGQYYSGDSSSMAGAEPAGAEGGEEGPVGGHGAAASTGIDPGNGVGPGAGGAAGGVGLVPPPHLPPPPSLDEVESRGVVVPPPPLPDAHHGLGMAGMPPTVPMASRASSSSSGGSMPGVGLGVVPGMGGPPGMGTMLKPPKPVDPSKGVGAGKVPLRRGKWTFQEEAYVSRIIHDFNQGLLPLTAGTTLRAYLSDTLNCDPMVRAVANGKNRGSNLVPIRSRFLTTTPTCAHPQPQRITKKFAGAACIGKRVFQPCDPTPDNIERRRRAQAELEILRKEFLRTTTPGAGGVSMLPAHPYGAPGGLLMPPLVPPPPVGNPMARGHQHWGAHAARGVPTPGYPFAPPGLPPPPGYGSPYGAPGGIYLPPPPIPGAAGRGGRDPYYGMPGAAGGAGAGDSKDGGWSPRSHPYAAHHATQQYHAHAAHAAAAAAYGHHPGAHVGAPSWGAPPPHAGLGQPPPHPHEMVSGAAPGLGGHVSSYPGYDPASMAAMGMAGAAGALHQQAAAALATGENGAASVANGTGNGAAGSGGSSPSAAADAKAGLPPYAVEKCPTPTDRESANGSSGADDPAAAGARSRSSSPSAVSAGAGEEGGKDAPTNGTGSGSLTSSPASGEGGSGRGAAQPEPGATNGAAGGSGHSSPRGDVEDEEGGEPQRVSRYRPPRSSSEPREWSSAAAAATAAAHGGGESKKAAAAAAALLGGGEDGGKPPAGPKPKPNHTEGELLLDFLITVRRQHEEATVSKSSEGGGSPTSGSGSGGGTSPMGSRKGEGDEAVAAAAGKGEGAEGGRMKNGRAATNGASPSGPALKKARSCEAFRI